MAQADKRISGYSYLRIAATFAVMVLHVCTVLADNSDYYGLTFAERGFFTAIRHVVTWGVPCFVLITGGLFLRKEKTVTIRECLLKYIRRLVLALLIFGIPYAFLIEYEAVRVFSLRMVLNALLRVVTDGSFAHLWFLYMLIGLMLLLPFYKAFINHCSKRTVEYVLGLLFVFLSLIPFLTGIFHFQIGFYLPGGSCFLFYLLFGGYLANYRPRLFEKTGLLLSCVCAVLILFLILSLTGSQLIGLFTVPESPFVALLSCSLFALFRRIRKPAPGWIWSVDRLCFGAYLVHMYFLQTLYRVVKITPTGSVFPLKFLGVAVLIIGVSFGASWVLNKIGPLRRYVL